MLVHILILQSTSPRSQKFTQWLRDHGYQISFGDDLPRIRKMVARGDFQLVLRMGTHHHRAHADLCRDLTRAHPYLPILQILAPAVAKVEGTHEDVFHEYASVTLSRPALLERVRRLVTLGNLCKRVNETEYAQARIEHHLGRINLTSSLEVVTHSLEFLRELSSCENAFWISAAGMTFDYQSLDPKHNSQRVLLSQADFVSLKPFKTSEGLEKIIHKVKDMPQRDRDGEPQQLWKWPDENMWVIAMRSHVGGNPLGCFFLSGAKPLPEGLSAVLYAIETRLTYAYAFESSRQMSYMDDLTSLYNQRYLPLVLHQEMNRAQREQRKLSVLFLDVDFFKTVNDTQGHLVGSRVLVQIADLLRECTRSFDYVFRYGGDEFVAVLPGADVEEAKGVAERIRQQTELSTFVADAANPNSSKVHVTLSIGIATFPDHAKSAEEVLHLADQAMYYGKKSCRNIVYVAS
jgi:diguanylate cyclase (GGDEF)-like protein